MRLGAHLARTRQRIHTLQDFSGAVQRRLGLESHAQVLGFAARLALQRLRSAAAAGNAQDSALHSNAAADWELHRYGPAPTTAAGHALFLELGQQPIEQARVQLFCLALDPVMVANPMVLGLIAHDPTLQMQLAAEVGDWACLLNRPLWLCYASGPQMLAAQDVIRLHQALDLDRLTVLDADWIHEGIDALIELPPAPLPVSTPASACGFQVQDGRASALPTPTGSRRGAAPMPAWSAAANRFGGLIPWIERGARLLDRAGSALGKIGIGAGPGSAVIDLCLRLPDASLFVGGWWTSTQDPVVDIAPAGVGAGGERLSFTFVPRPDLPIALRRLVPDLPAEGFVAHLEASTGTHPCEALRLRLASGRVQELRLQPQDGGERLAAADRLLSHLPSAHPRLRQMLDTVFGPALAALGPAPPLREQDIVLRDHGQVPQAPELSLVVPLYGRDDFLRHQLAHFCGDPHFAAVELIYVIDDPRLVDRVEAAAADLAQLFGLAFRTVHAQRNLGYAGANNLGVRCARAPVLLLLNSDVVPLPGRDWIGPMRAALQLPGTGAVGARLLFEDGSVQHAGMRSAAYPPWGDLPINLHPGKSLPDLPRSGCEELAAVTGACLMLPTALYREIGGLDEGFLVGDFEDSELCARLRRRGLSIRLCHDAVLVHLERQSMPTGAEAQTQGRRTLYNAWRAAQLESQQEVSP